MVILFALTRLSGNPLALLMPPNATPDDYAHMSARLGLDKPIVVQFWIFITHAVTGDFGNSFHFDQGALSLAWHRLPNTVELAFAAMLIGVVVGLPLGIIAAVKKGSIVDQVAKLIAFIGQSSPTFWIGLMLILFFAVQWHLLPVSGIGGIRHLILPAVTLSGYPLALVVRVTRSSMLDVLDSEHIRTSRMYGVPERLVVFKHALKNAAIPIVTIIGLQLGMLLGSAVVTESVFAWPGIGKLTIDGVFTRDFPVVQAAVFLTGSMFVLINLIVDLTYAYFDPRIRYV